MAGQGTGRKGGFRSGTRRKLKKPAGTSGKVTITRLLQKFNIGEKVRILQEPAVQKGMPHPRFKNKVGTIKSKEGKNAYELTIKDGNKIKTVISRAVHLVRLK
jgi:large subunit ribosomal protein L21e|tara:strand:- start:1815 stop:2123 length:309 start_codon:yes stop_codon:yes gene_type:complete